MAITEDAASVLEDFIQDVANLPGEIVHLLEEIEAKDQAQQKHRRDNSSREAKIQKFLKLNGAGKVNPDEEAHCAAINANYDEMEILQDEQVALSNKANLLIDRHVRRLDIQIRDLNNEGVMPTDPTLPSSLASSTTAGTRFLPLTVSSTTASTPLHPIHGNANVPSTTIANSTIARLVQPQSATSARHPSPSLHGHHPLSVSSQTPTSAIPPSIQRARESSLGASGDANKRRRLNLPTGQSLLRQSSLGPGTLKPGTPTAVRGGSAGPGRAGVVKKPVGKKVAPHQRVGHLNPSSAATSKKGGSSRRRGKKSMGKLSPSTGDDESALSETETSDAERRNQMSSAKDLGLQAQGAGLSNVDGMYDAEDYDDQDDNERVYCTCQNVSSGSMVACDNLDCPYEWFHWSCVGLTREPVGTWYCDECKAKLGVCSK